MVSHDFSPYLANYRVASQVNPPKIKKPTFKAVGISDIAFASRINRLVVIHLTAHIAAGWHGERPTLDAGADCVVAKNACQMILWLSA